MCAVTCRFIHLRPLAGCFCLVTVRKLLMVNFHKLGGCTLDFFPICGIINRESSVAAIFVVGKVTLTANLGTSIGDYTYILLRKVAMKKAFLAMFAVLFGLVVVTCDVNPLVTCDVNPLTETSGNSNVVYDEDGKPWGVNLSINTGPLIIPDPLNRALSGPLAQSWVNYYEVVFRTGGTNYRARWRTGEVGKIAIPFGDYSSVNPTSTAAAILFAGRVETKTLLAVGRLTATTGSNYPAINAGTTGVTFTLTPLTTDVKADPTSSFQISLGPTFPTDDYTAMNFPTVSYNGADVPLFKVATGPTVNSATYAIGGITNTNRDAVRIVAPPTLIPETVLTQDGSVNSFTPTNLSVSTIFTPGAACPTLNSIAISITVPTNAAGLFAFMLNIPVKAMDSTDVNGDTWYIQGGLRNSAYDMGPGDPGVGALGGKILLGTEGLSNTADIQITVAP